MPAQNARSPVPVSTSTRISGIRLRGDHRGAEVGGQLRAEGVPRVRAG